MRDKNKPAKKKVAHPLKGKNPIDPKTGRPRRGNPNFVPGHKMGGRPKAGLRVRNMRCATFMEEKGWGLLEDACGMVGHRNQVAALKLEAAYAYGEPTQAVEVSTPDGQATTIVAFLGGSKDKSEGTDD